MFTLCESVSYINSAFWLVSECFFYPIHTSWRLRKSKHASSLSSTRTSMAKKRGRKRVTPIWDYFEYDSDSNTSKCLSVKGRKVCGVRLKGKNPTNLKMHLRRYHKETNRAYLAKVRKSAQPLSPEQGANPWKGSTMETTTRQTRPMQSFHQQPDSCWSVHTKEHKDTMLCLICTE